MCSKKSPFSVRRYESTFPCFCSQFFSSVPTRKNFKKHGERRRKSKTVKKCTEFCILFCMLSFSRIYALGKSKGKTVGTPFVLPLHGWGREIVVGNLLFSISKARILIATTFFAIKSRINYCPVKYLRWKLDTHAQCRLHSENFFVIDKN